MLPLEAKRNSTICRLLLPSFLIAPIAFCDRLLAVCTGSIPSGVQGLFYALQAASALGISLGLGRIVFSLFRLEQVAR